jgi:hypothetical protein
LKRIFIKMIKIWSLEHPIQLHCIRNRHRVLQKQETRGAFLRAANNEKKTKGNINE